LLALFSASMLMATLVPAPAAQASSAAPLIVIDPGHGGRYSNANANGLREKNVNLAIAKELRSTLIARGYRVAMTRTTDRAVRLRYTHLAFRWSNYQVIRDYRLATWRSARRLAGARRRAVGADLFISSTLVRRGRSA
jgi:N-acetylmuramoyl-L-alanine amidase